MTALCILIAIFLVIAGLLFSGLSLECNISEEINVKLKYLGFGKTLYPTADKKRKRTDKNLAGDGQKSDGKLRQMLDEKGLAATVGELLDVVKIVLSRLGKAVKHIRVKYFSLTLNVASPDPAKTAVEYGAVCSVVYPVLSGLQEQMKWNLSKTFISVSSDFCSDKPTVYIAFKIKLKLWFIVKLGLGVLASLVKIKVKDAIAKQKADIKLHNNVNNKLK